MNPNSVSNKHATQVECYSGGEYAERPRAFEWEGRHHKVNEIITRWRLPDGPGFRVSTPAGLIFELVYREWEDRWDILPVTDG